MKTKNIEKTLEKTTGFHALPGNECLKRALEVAAAGKLRVLAVGIPELLRLAEESGAAIGAEVSAVSPCPCGNFGDYILECTCTAHKIIVHRRQLRERLPEFHIIAEVTRVAADKVLNPCGEPAEAVRARVAAYKGPAAEVSQDSEELLTHATAKLRMAPAAVRNTLRVAGVIAGLAGRDVAGCADVAEAIQWQASRAFDQPA